MYTINLKTLKALAKLAPKDDVRYYLNGVNIEINGNESLYTVTNGHYLAIYHEQTQNEGALNIIIPRDKLISQKFTRFDTDVYALSKQGNEVYSVRDTLFKPIDGRYPNWRLVIPRPSECFPNNPGQQFNKGYLDAIVSVYAEITGNKGCEMEVRYNANRDKCALMLGNNENFVAVIMPIRELDKDAPSWYRDLSLKQPETKAA